MFEITLHDEDDVIEFIKMVQILAHHIPCNCVRQPYECDGESE